MRVIATAGHVDHGKSTLVRRLTGMEPDRWAEERRRGLTLDLGFAWTGIGGEEVAFVDVPGHERFVPTMLAGAGPAPAVLFVVAADEGWKPQSAEHLAALDAFGAGHCLLVVTKADRADPAAAAAAAVAEISRTSLGRPPVVAVSAVTGAGIEELRTAIGELTAALPPPDPGADVRLWLDRAFTVKGAGTVVTGTLTAGTIAIGDELLLGSSRVKVRGLQALGRASERVPAAARVAVNLRGTARAEVRRGKVLLAPGAWLTTAELDVRLRGAASADLHREHVLHLGTAAVPVRVRPLGSDTVRLTLATALPLRVGDRGLLRDPGEHRIAAGFDVLDVRPPRLARRGAARARAEDLAAKDLGRGYLRRNGFVPAADLRAMGLPETGDRLGDWCVDPARMTRLRAEVAEVVEGWHRGHVVAAGMPVETLRQQLGLPAPGLVGPVLAGTGLIVDGGLVRRPDLGLAPEVDRAVRALEERFTESPFRAPEADELRELGLGRRELAAAVRLGRLSLVAEGVVLGPDAQERAVTALAGLGQPFTVSAARRALGSTRRVMIPLLERLDAAGRTEPLGDGTRRVAG
ncbi:selenocysteine-specific translation elongation factor [Amycolatopsis saalfeldensis]|uniref:Selenocysteine-specific translation elongation factor SelB n=1 Tax=Amycolatopsis saalfeldensis TaxID=394193 RepID=A0A1H8XCJ0_9PSEU|nr:selenocysteine-specific translation elongation factor [Amycolatopsis saalfeldensis]SEP37477.1 selenocysteine-specific translation elongation factor SelB [Amycolatopsis saalfeldensis]